MLASFFVLIAIHGSFLAVILYFGSTENRTANRVLGHMITVLSVILLMHGLGISGVREQLPHLKEVDLALWFLIAPLTYSYVRRLCGQGRSRGEISQYLVFLGVTLALTPFFVLSGQEKIEVGGLYRQFGVPGVMVVTLTFATATFVSVFLSRRVLQQAVSEDASAEQEPWRFLWLQRLLTVLAFFAAQDSISGSIFSYYRFYPDWLLTANFMGYSGLLYGVAYLMVVHREGFLKPITDAVKEKAQRAAADKEIARADVGRLQDLMGRDRLYRQDDLSLESLASQLEMSRHRLSHLINQEMGVSFHDLINRYRIEEAKERLLRESEELGPLEIAAEAGFGSRASFYRAFKKHTGMTPRQYLNRKSSNTYPTEEGLSS